MNEDNNKPLKIFRYKLDSLVSEKMIAFAKVHENDERVVFNEAWEKWKIANNDMIQREKLRLTNEGYNGNIYDKIRRSIRYYYSKKSDKKTKTKPRRKYIHINKDILQNIDAHIKNGMKQKIFKPSVGFESFIKNNKADVSTEFKRIMKAHSMCKEDIISKFQKTYNNRYFIYKKSIMNKI